MVSGESEVEAGGSLGQRDVAEAGDVGDRDEGQGGRGAPHHLHRGVVAATYVHRSQQYLRWCWCEGWMCKRTERKNLIGWRLTK